MKSTSEDICKKAQHLPPENFGPTKEDSVCPRENKIQELFVGCGV